MRTTNTNLAPSLWAQPVWTPAQAEELSWRSMSKRGSTLASRRTPFTVQAMASPQGPPPPSPETGSIRWRGFWRAGPTRRTLGRRLLVRVGADPIHHQPPQPGHLGAQGLVVSRRYCRKSSRLMSARRGMSTITFNTWASFSVLCRSERAAAVGRLTELRYRRLSGGRECRTGRGPGPCMQSLPSRPAYCLSQPSYCRLVRSSASPCRSPLSLPLAANVVTASGKPEDLVTAVDGWAPSAASFDDVSRIL
jgi:hypothetical protein